MLQLICEMSDERTLAIVSQDTDFMIYQLPDHVHYLSAQNFNFGELFQVDSLGILRILHFGRKVLRQIFVTAKIE
jgi:hypothetical protein